MLRKKLPPFPNILYHSGMGRKNMTFTFKLFVYMSLYLDETDSYMYQSVGHDALDLYACALELPLFQQIIEGKPLNQQFDYQPTKGDEVEDLYELLCKVKVCNIFLLPALLFVP